MVQGIITLSIPLNFIDLRTKEKKKLITVVMIHLVLLFNEAEFIYFFSNSFYEMSIRPYVEE